jgi:RNA polymerase sigma-54 factor
MTAASYSLRATQQLAVSPRLQQAIRLLQVSSLELEEELRTAVASNPFLEEDDSERSVDGSGQIEQRSNVEPATVEADSAALLSSMPEYGSTAGSSRNPGFADDESDSVERACQQPGLRDHLRAQISGASSSPRERFAIEMLIETIEDDGYLRSAVPESMRVLELGAPLTEEEMESALRKLQCFDPVGVGARSLSECLALQIQHGDVEGVDRNLALEIVGEHLPLLARRDYAVLRQQLACSDDSLQRAITLIRRLDPHPGDRYSATPAGYVTPDVIVTMEGGRLTTIINPAVRPRTQLNTSYARLLRQARSGANPGLYQQLREARWLMRNVEQRFVTIKRVADAIVKRQRTFFSYGDVALKPLVLREIADELALHESTISRATGNKYMETPRGTFEFKHFFSRELPTGTGGRCSAAAVRALIQEIIDQEDRRDPLSDVTLAQMLTEQGICIARRTVTKYRTMMKVPPAELRKSA